MIIISILKRNNDRLKEWAYSRFEIFQGEKNEILNISPPIHNKSYGFNKNSNGACPQSGYS
jgi:hypothetical protein